jgi:hypothetical protein
MWWKYSLFQRAKYALAFLAAIALIGTAWAQGEGPSCTKCIQACDPTCTDIPMNCGIPDGNWVCTNSFTVPCSGTYYVIAISNCGTECDCWNFIACAALMQEGVSTPICSPHTINCYSAHECTHYASVTLTAGVNYKLCAGRFPCEGGFTCSSCDIPQNPCAAVAQLKRNLTDTCNFAACP